MENGSRVDFDRLGSIASIACALHCVLSGFAIGLISAFGLQFLASEKTELLFIAVTLGLGTIAIVSGYRKHKKRWPLLLFSGGAILIGASHFLFHDHTVHPVSRLVSILGAGLLITFHYFNHKLSKVS